MKRRTGLLCVGALVWLTSPSMAWGDAMSDLAAGRDALAAGDLDKAVALLTSAAGNLPESVEAQVALGQAYLRLGKLNEALVQYQVVLRLSPQHAQAKAVVTALTGRRDTVQQRLDYARALMDLQAFPAAQRVLEGLLHEVTDAGLRTATRGMLAECKLWSNAVADALADAMGVAKEASDAAVAGRARIVAALALAGSGVNSLYPEEQAAQAAGLIKDVAAPAAPLAPWAELVRLWVQLEQTPTRAADVSAKLPGPLASLPGGAFRSTMVARLEAKLSQQARRLLDKGDAEMAMAIVWPIVSDQPAPAADAVGKALAVKGGWCLDGAVALECRLHVADALMGIGRLEHARQGAAASLLGYWLAAQVVLSAPQTVQPDGSSPTDRLLPLGAELAGLSKPDPARKPAPRGEPDQPLCQADKVLYQLILLMADRITDPAKRPNVVGLIAEQIKRYEAAGDLETGLAQFVTIQDAPAGDPKAQPKPPKVDPAGPLASWPPSAAHQQLLQLLAGSYLKLGVKAFQEAAATLDPAANSTLNRYDRIALVLLARQAALYPTADPAAGGAQSVFDRYAGASMWAPVQAGMALFYGAQAGDAGAWALIGLRIRQATAAEDKLLSARKKLPAQLRAEIVWALEEARKLVAANPATAVRQRGIALVGPLIGRYAGLDRADLVEAVIAALAGPDAGGSLADWALWARADLLNRQAGAALVRKAKEFEAAPKLTLLPAHAQALKILGQLVEQYPTSEYLPGVVDMVVAMSATYRDQKAYGPAAEVLAGFLQAHPKLSARERLRYAQVGVALSRSNTAFAEQREKQKEAVPEKLSEEYAAAIDALASFLEEYPAGDQARSAGNDLFQIATAYAQAGAWAVARGVLDRFAKAQPDFASPQMIRFFLAATYLGELDQAHALGLLALPPEGAVNGKIGKDVGTDLPTSLDLAKTESGPVSGPAGLTVSTAKPDARAPARGRTNIAPATETPPHPVQPPGEEIALAQVRQSEQRLAQQVARMKEPEGQQGQPAHAAQQEADQSVVTPGGPVLSEAEMKRQDAAADSAYAILIGLANEPALAGKWLEGRARAEILWMIGFLEGQDRHDRAAAVIARYLTDRPTEPARIDLSFRAIGNQLAWAGQAKPGDRIDLAWIDQRHERFEQARLKIDAFAKEFAHRREWFVSARILAAESCQQEATLASQVSAARAGGLLARSAQELMALAVQLPQEPATREIPGRLWALAARLEGLRQREQAIHVLGEIPIRFPLDPHAVQAVLRIGELYAADLNSPLRAMETYQEYLSLAGDNEPIRVRIFTIAQQLAGQQRYLEALRVYGAFVDSFPGDLRAAQALQAIGQTHQANEAWTDAIAAYQRILGEYPGAAVTPGIQLAIAECQTNLSEWKAARKTYEEYLQKYGGAEPKPAPPAPQPEAANAPAKPPDQQPPPGADPESIRKRIEILKTLDRYQMLLADALVTRNKDDAQFQIGRIVLEQLNYPGKAVVEFRKVIEKFPRSDLASASQLEIGKALLAMGRIDEARRELLKVPAEYPNSPVADMALFLTGQSYERQAERLASVTVQKVREELFEKGQKAAYQQFQAANFENAGQLSKRRTQLKSAGKSAELDQDEAYGAARFNGMNDANIRNTVRQAEVQAETESALQAANRQDRINEAYRQAVGLYAQVAKQYPLGSTTDKSLERMANIYETYLKDPAAAMETYQRIVQLFPGTPTAENAAWKVAKFHEQQGKYELAVTAYRDFIRTYPASSHVADAQYALAEALEQQGRWVEAMDAYQTFRDKFTSHPKATRAAEQIQWIKAYRK